MNNQPKDISLDTPGEANKEKHLNFREVEEESAASDTSSIDNADVDKNKGPLFMNDESPMKSVKRAANEMFRNDSDTSEENK